MGRLIILATVVALAVAKPELYKEKEDFQYARSSSDEGTKSGSYGAQRGNMGGNYERAHNMDYLAQHQMGSLVSQVHGELGDAAKAKTGNVFASSNSRGMYGSGHHDLSNVQGRNFQEGVSFEDSMAAGQSSAYKHSAATQNFAHTGNTNNYRQYAGQTGQTGLTGQYLLGANDAEHLYTNNYARNQDAISSHYLQSGYQEQKAYEHGSSNQYATSGQNSDVRTRLISARPIRVVVRPGSTVTVPVAAQTFDSTHRHIGSVYDQNSFNTEAEDLNSIDNTKNIIIPTNKAKHYESSYSYQKEWEKHDTKPVAVPLGIQTENPLANERYISGGLDSESHVNQASGYQAARLSNSHNSYNTKSSQALHHSGYNAQQQHYGSSSQAYQQDIEKANQDALAATLIKNKPSNYQSSYSYHKSWERQGDPYVIKPSSYNQQTQRLTDASAISSHHYGSQNRKGYQQNSQIIEDCDCEEDQGHIRMVRSYNQKLIQQSQNLEDLGQQTQNLEDLGQQTQNLEDLGQLNQGHWQNADDLGQQIQQQNQWGNLQDLGQQSQTQWGNLDDLGQQSQGNGKFNRISAERVHHHNRHRRDNSDQNQWKNLGSQTKQNWEKFKTEGDWSNKDALRKQTENDWNNAKVNQRHRRDNEGQQQNRQKTKELREKTQKDWENFRAEGNWEKAPALRQETDKNWHDAREKLWGHNSNHQHNHHNNEDTNHHHHNHN